MNKLIKGAITGAAGIALLLGGAGTFASWNDSASIGSHAQQIHTGSLKFDTTTKPAGSWYEFDKTTTLSNTFLAVPGDTVYYKATATIDAEGDNLEAQFGVDHTVVTAKLTNGGDTGAVTATVDSVSGTGIAATTTPDVYTVQTNAAPIDVTVWIKVTFNASDTDAQNTTITLADLPLTLTQK